MVFSGEQELNFNCDCVKILKGKFMKGFLCANVLFAMLPYRSYMYNWFQRTDDLRMGGAQQHSNWVYNQTAGYQK